MWRRLLQERADLFSVSLKLPGALLGLLQNYDIATEKVYSIPVKRVRS